MDRLQAIHAMPTVSLGWNSLAHTGSELGEVAVPQEYGGQIRCCEVYIPSVHSSDILIDFIQVFRLDLPVLLSRNV